jgi:anaerobic selenocysteine-containing dehydrogenase
MAAVSRRDFLKTAGAIGVGAAAGIGFPAVLRAQGGGTVKVGVLHSSARCRSVTSA